MKVGLVLYKGFLLLLLTLSAVFGIMFIGSSNGLAAVFSVLFIVIAGVLLGFPSWAVKNRSTPIVYYGFSTFIFILCGLGAYTYEPGSGRGFILDEFLDTIFYAAGKPGVIIFYLLFGFVLTRVLRKGQ